MSTADGVIADITFGQLGLVTRPQLLATGLTERQIEFRLDTQTLVPIHPRVYRLAGAPASWEQRVLAACLASGGVASHQTAASLYRLRGFGQPRDRQSRDAVDVTVEGRGRKLRLEGVTVHVTDHMERTTVGPVPATRPAPTLLAVAGAVPRLAEGALSDALVRRLVRVHPLAEWILGACRPGRPGGAYLRELLEPYIKGMQPTESWLEDRLLEALRAAGLPEPVRQYRLEVAGRRFRLDFAYREVPLDLEADGRLWHASPSAQRRDAERDAIVGADGWAVERVTWWDLERDRAAVVARVARHLESARRRVA